MRHHRHSRISLSSTLRMSREKKWISLTNVVALLVSLSEWMPEAVYMSDLGRTAISNKEQACACERRGKGTNNETSP